MRPIASALTAVVLATLLMAAHPGQSAPATTATFRHRVLEADHEKKGLVLKVNGQQVMPASKPVVVRLAQPPQFDRIELRDRRADGPDAVSVSFARFTAGAEYEVRQNPCSFFEIADVAIEQSKGTFVLSVDPATPWPVLFGYGQEPLGPGQHTELREASHSAMCARAVEHFAVTTVPKGDDDPRPLTASGFLFLNDEHLTVTYRPKPKPHLDFALTPRPAGAQRPSDVEPVGEPPKP